MKATASDINRIARLGEAGFTNQVRKELKQFPEAIKHSQITLAAIKGAALDVLQLLFASGADIASSGNALLNEAAIAQPEILKLCLSELEARFEQKPDVLYARGCAMLSYAAAHAKLENVSTLLEKGYGSINPTHLNQPLMDAGKKGSLETVELLLQHQAKAENIHFNAAAEHGHLGVMVALKSNNPTLTVDRQVAKVVADKREAAIGTSQFERWAEIADMCQPAHRQHRSLS